MFPHRRTAFILCVLLGGPPGMQPGMAPLPPPQQAEGEQGGKQKKDGPQLGGPPGMQPGMAPLPPPHEAAGPTGKPEGSEKKGKKGWPPCPEGTVLLENGMCAPPHQ